MKDAYETSSVAHQPHRRDRAAAVKSRLEARVGSGQGSDVVRLFLKEGLRLFHDLRHYLRH